MKDWEAYKLITDLIDNLEHSSPVHLSVEASDAWYDATKAVEKQLKEARKPFEDRIYAAYLEKGRAPWCDVCGMRVAGYATGWEHVGDIDPWIAPHEIVTKGYHWGSEVEVQKRLRFEI